MEQSIEKLDFEETDQMVQVHGTFPLANLPWFWSGGMLIVGTDYKGVTLSSRDANSKNAASEATNIFQNHYPEFLVSPPPPIKTSQTKPPHTVPQILHKRPNPPRLDLLGLQIARLSTDVREDERSGEWAACDRQGA